MSEPRRITPNKVTYVKPRRRCPGVPAHLAPDGRARACGRPTADYRCEDCWKIIRGGARNDPMEGFSGGSTLNQTGGLP